MFRKNYRKVGLDMQKCVDIIGVPLDLGASRRGVDMGPSAIRYAGLENRIKKLGIGCKDKGNVEVIVPESVDGRGQSNCKHIKEITMANSLLCKEVKESLENKRFPIVIGGDHSIAVGSIFGAQSYFGNIGVIWLDAHGDFNNEKISLSGNPHGMSLAAVCGFGPKDMVSFKGEGVAFINPKNVALVGARDLDKGEEEALREAGVNVFSIADIDKFGMKEVMAKAIELVEEGTDGFHLSFDLDAISPNEATGVGTPVPGGLTYREAHLAVEMMAERDKLICAEVVELNPIMDEKNATGKLAVELIESILGKKQLSNNPCFR